MSVAVGSDGAMDYEGRNDGVSVPCEVRMAHVLIVEDDRDIRDTLADVLQSEGYEVACARNGLEGLIAARHHHPDVIVLDLMMPVMNGWQFREQQRMDASIRDVPVVVISAARDRADIDVREYIAKPCDLNDLLDTVRRVMSA